MTKRMQTAVLIAVSLLACVGLVFVGCKKDDNPAGPGGGGGGVTSLNFTTPNQSLPASVGGGQARAKLGGGTLPYFVTAPPAANVATAAFVPANSDTLVVTPIGPGTTSITITDSNPIAGDNPPRTVTIGITVSGGGGGGGSLGSGTITASSSLGNLSFNGPGTFPIGAGPAVIAVFDTAQNFLQIVGYQQVSGRIYKLVEVKVAGTTLPVTGTFPIGTQSSIIMGYDVDTSSNFDNTALVATTGNVVVTSVSGTSVAGSFAGSGTRITPQAQSALNGSFTVTYVRGRAIGGSGGGGGGNLTAIPPSISVAVGATGTSTVSGGTAPYSIQTAPTASIATATISGAVVTGRGVAQGSTAVVVRDNSNPALTVSIPINVGGGGGGGQGSGSLSFNSTQGNYSASGTFDSTYAGTQGAGGFRFTDTGAGYLQILAYKVNTRTDISLVTLTLRNPGALTTGTYTVGGNPNTSPVAAWTWAPHVDPNQPQTANDTYLLTTGSTNLSTLTTTNAQGTFSGAGIYIVIPTQTITVSAGTFNINYVNQGPSNSLEKKLAVIAQRMIEQTSKQARPNK